MLRGGLNPPFFTLEYYGGYKRKRQGKKMGRKMMNNKPSRRIQQQCPECGHPYIHEITITGRYEWTCPKCGLIIWEAGEYEYGTHNMQKREQDNKTRRVRETTKRTS